MSLDLLRQKLPEVESWVARTVAAHAAQAQPVASFGFTRLGDYYPASLLHAAKVVVGDGLRFAGAIRGRRAAL